MATAGLILIVVLVLLGAPVWAAVLAGASIALWAWGMAPEVMASVMFTKMANMGLVAVPLFIFAGQLLAVGGIAKPLIDLLSRFMGHIPGGPAYAIIGACVVFAAMSSSGLAAMAGFAPVALPLMEKTGYSRRFSIGLLICASALGPLIPPSVYLIIFGFLTEQSVKDLWTAAFLPGFMLAAFLAVTVFIHTRRGHYVAPPPATWRERRDALWRAGPILLMPAIVLVPIYLGWDTATEAAAVAVVYTLFLGFVVYRELTPRKVWESAVVSAHLVSMIFLIVAGAFMLSLAFTYMRIPFKLTDFIAGAGFGSLSFPIFIRARIRYDIYKNYGKNIDDFKGNIKQFRGIKSLVENHLNISLLYPLRVSMNEKVKLNQAEKEMINKALNFMKENNFDHFYSLYLLPANMCTPNDYKAILNLIQKGIFQPVND